MRQILAGLVALLATTAANAAPIYLDFDTPATGSNIIGAPLVTPAGTITAINAELVAFASDPDFNAAGSLGNQIDHLGSPSIAALEFDFDVDSISLIYGGNIGDITINALDAANNIVDTFFQASTDDGQPAGPITLTGTGIRRLEWFESSGSFAGLDNLEITPAAAVPEPLSVLVFGGLLAGGGLAARRRMKKAAA